jgi:hypothetical protein
MSLYFPVKALRSTAKSGNPPEPLPGSSSQAITRQKRLPLFSEQTGKGMELDAKMPRTRKDGQEHPDIAIVLEINPDLIVYGVPLELS